MRISDHALDSRFFGVVGTEWPDLDLTVGSPDTMVWEDARCHRERGLPKVGFLALDGTLPGGAGRVAAMVRQNGMRLPHDEIVERKVLDPPGSTVVLAIEGATKTSGLRVRIALHAAACRIE